MAAFVAAVAISNSTYVGGGCGGGVVMVVSDGYRTGIELDTISISAKRFLYDIDIRGVLNLVQYQRNKCGNARGCRAKHLLYDIAKLRYLEISKLSICPVMKKIDTISNTIFDNSRYRSFRYIGIYLNLNISTYRNFDIASYRKLLHNQQH